MTEFNARAEARNAVEQRSTSFGEMDLKSTPDGTGGENLTFRGYASVVNSPYMVTDFLGEYQETVRSGSFTKTLAENADVPFKLNHDGPTLARTKSGTMHLAEDSTGLFVEAKLDPRNPIVQGIRSAMERGDMDEMSFAFRAVREDWNRDYTERDLTEVSLHKGDVSLVNFGANPAANGASIRSRELMDALHRLNLRADTLSPEDKEKLRHVLQLIAAADSAVDVAQPVLAEVLGVPNPDADHQEAPTEKKGDVTLFEHRLRALNL